VALVSNSMLGTGCGNVYCTAHASHSPNMNCRSSTA
jgi:hypothetical protein